MLHTLPSEVYAWRQELSSASKEARTPGAAHAPDANANANAHAHATSPVVASLAPVPTQAFRGVSEGVDGSFDGGGGGGFAYLSFADPSLRLGGAGGLVAEAMR